MEAGNQPPYLEELLLLCVLSDGEAVCVVEDQDLGARQLLLLLEVSQR